MRVSQITPVFVEFIPDQLESGKLYISEEYETAVHKCCCGCGEEVVTPLSPADWRCTKGANGVSLSPSIGNWSYQCKSHYFIRHNKVVWAGSMTDSQIEQVKNQDLNDKANYIHERNESIKPLWFKRVWRWILDLFR